jgi:hypothetical protein
LFWRASSSSGDYHDNMNSEMFLKWVKDKLVPTFEQLYPGKKMKLICDNAPYHHKREIGSLASKSKLQLIDICNKYNIEYIDVKLNEARNIAMATHDIIDNIDPNIGDNCCRIAFDSDFFYKEQRHQSHLFQQPKN